MNTVLEAFKTMGTQEYLGTTTQNLMSEYYFWYSYYLVHLNACGESFAYYVGCNPLDSELSCPIAIIPKESLGEEVTPEALQRLSYEFINKPNRVVVIRKLLDFACLQQVLTTTAVRLPQHGVEWQGIKVCYLHDNLFPSKRVQQVHELFGAIGNKYLLTSYIPVVLFIQTASGHLISTMSMG